MSLSLGKWQRWCAIVRRDWLHSASGTRYCIKGPVSWKAYAYALLTSEFQAVFFYRIYSAFYHAGWRLPGLFIYLIVKFLYKCDIYPKSRIGEGFLLVHAFDIVVGADVELGSDVVIFNGVSLGKKHSGVMGAGMPKVGNGCLLGSGAKILGAIVIGDNVTVGANAVVLSDVPDQAVCVGNPARVILKSEGQPEIDQ